MTDHLASRTSLKSTHPTLLQTTSTTILSNTRCCRTHSSSSKTRGGTTCHFSKKSLFTSVTLSIVHLCSETPSTEVPMRLTNRTRACWPTTKKSDQRTTLTTRCFWSLSCTTSVNTADHLHPCRTSFQKLRTYLVQSDKTWMKAQRIKIQWIEIINIINLNFKWSAIIQN